MFKVTVTFTDQPTPVDLAADSVDAEPAVLRVEVAADSTVTFYPWHTIQSAVVTSVDEKGNVTKPVPPIVTSSDIKPQRRV